jgi:hypothetical protein
VSWNPAELKSVVWFDPYCTDGVYGEIGSLLVAAPAGTGVGSTSTSEVVDSLGLIADVDANSPVAALDVPLWLDLSNTTCDVSVLVTKKIISRPESPLAGGSVSAQQIRQLQIHFVP